MSKPQTNKMFQSKNKLIRWAAQDKKSLLFWYIPLFISVFWDWLQTPISLSSQVPLLQVALPLPTISLYLSSQVIKIFEPLKKSLSVWSLLTFECAGIVKWSRSQTVMMNDELRFDTYIMLCRHHKIGIVSICVGLTWLPTCCLFIQRKIHVEQRFKWKGS